MNVFPLNPNANCVVSIAVFGDSSRSVTYLRTVAVGRGPGRRRSPPPPPRGCRGDLELEVPRQGRHLDAGVVDGELQFDHLVAHERILALDGVDGVRDVAGEFR
jgi:hypothetical protein